MELHKEVICLSFHSPDSRFTLYEVCINFLPLMDLQTLHGTSLYRNQRQNLFLLCLDANLKQASHF